MDAAAVKPQSHYRKKMGRHLTCSLSQKTCQISYLIIHGFRVKGMECKSCKAFIFLSFLFFREQSQKIFHYEKENFYCGCCNYQ